MKRALKLTVLFLIDIILLYLSLFLVIYYRYHNAFSFPLFTEHLVAFSIIYIIWIIIFYFWDFYKLEATWDFRDIFKAMFLNGVIAILFFYLLPYFNIAPKRILVLNIAVYYFFLIGWRFLFKKVNKDIAKMNNVVLIGVDAHSLELIQDLLQNKKTPYSLVTIINLDKQKIPAWLQKKHKQGIINTIRDLAAVIKQKQIHTVVVTDKWYSRLFQELYYLIHKGIDLYHIASFSEEYKRSIPIYATNELWFLENLRGFSKDLYEKQKRIIDILICFLVFPFFICASFFIIIALVLDSRGPIIYKQKRVGKNNKAFLMYKFRTMVADAEKHGPQWAEKVDPRVTRIGKLLRPARLDELPQIINILKGDMNFIGPRAERPEFVKTLSKKIPHYDLRHLIRPGLSGWAQVNFDYTASEEETAKKLEYDLYYLKNRSHLLDFMIILKTIGIILRRKGR